MTHDQFQIGLEFWCGGHQWRCTDIGSRVIVAISLEPHEVVEMAREASSGHVQERRFMTNDPTWRDGPSFAIVEEVFDEYAMDGCSLACESDPDARAGD